MDKSLTRRISMLPYFHLCFILTLLITASFGLSFSVYSILDRFRDCPVLNLSFVVFWFAGAVCCIQLGLGIFTLLLLLFVSCSCHCRRTQHLQTMSHLVTAVGPSGRFFLHHPGCLSFADKLHPGTPLGIDLSPEVELVPSRGCCPRPKPPKRVGWLQPVAIITAILLVAHLASLIWACSLYFELYSPRSSFASQVTNLFVEAKVNPNDITPPMDKKYSLTVRECWDRIQTDLKCCGPVRFTDWLTNSSTRGMSLTLEDVLPQSCYCPSSHECSVPYTVELSKGKAAEVGCIVPLRNRIGEHLLSIIVTAPVTFVLVMGTFLLDLSFTLRTAHLLLLQSESLSTIDYHY